jgi:hypothetical protein
VASIAAPSILLFDAPTRRQFFIQNNATTDLALTFNALINPSFAAGGEMWAVMLPGGTNAIYESPIGGYTGQVNGIWRTADANGEALVTQGFAF